MDDAINECGSLVPATADGSSRTFQLEWWTESVYELAKGIEAGWAFERMPILADALEEAGCDDEVILRHCRECQHHEPDCWVVETLLLFQTPQPSIEDAQALKASAAARVRDASATGESEQGYPRHQYPPPSPFALLLLVLIALVVICVIRFVFFGN